MPKDLGKYDFTYHDPFKNVLDIVLHKISKLKALIYFSKLHLF